MSKLVLICWGCAKKHGLNVLSPKQKNPQSQQRKAHVLFKFDFGPQSWSDLRLGFYPSHRHSLRKLPNISQRNDSRSTMQSPRLWLSDKILHLPLPKNKTPKKIVSKERTYYCAQFNMAICLISSPISSLSEATCAEKSYQDFKNWTWMP